MIFEAVLTVAALRHPSHFLHLSRDRYFGVTEYHVTIGYKFYVRCESKYKHLGSWEYGVKLSYPCHVSDSRCIAAPPLLMPAVSRKLSSSVDRGTPVS